MNLDDPNPKKNYKTITVPISDADPHWFYADQDPQNLVSADPDPLRIRLRILDNKNKITKFFKKYQFFNIQVKNTLNFQVWT